MKVTLFLQFGEILMLKMVSKDSQLWASKGARDQHQMKWDQASRGHFGHIYQCFDQLANLKKLVGPTVYLMKRDYFKNLCSFDGIISPPNETFMKRALHWGFR